MLSSLALHNPDKYPESNVLPELLFIYRSDPLFHLSIKKCADSFCVTVAQISSIQNYPVILWCLWWRMSCRLSRCDMNIKPICCSPFCSSGSECIARFIAGYIHKDNFFLSPVLSFSEHKEYCVILRSNSSCFMTQKELWLALAVAQPNGHFNYVLKHSSGPSSLNFLLLSDMPYPAFPFLDWLTWTGRWIRAENNNNVSM